MWTIRRLGDDDWQRLRDLRLRALDDEPDAFGSSLDDESAYGEVEWLELVRIGPWWVAVVDGADVGVVAGGHHRVTDVPWVFSMWVAPPWRGRGVADALLDEVARWAAGQGATSLGLDVTDRVPRARRFYERNGFVDTACSSPLPRDPSITLIEMCMVLPRPAPRDASSG